MSASGGLQRSQASDQTVTATSGDGAAVAQSAVLAGAGAQFTCIQGFAVTGGGATAGSVIQVTITGLLVPITFDLVIPAGPGNSIVPLIVNFGEGLIASASNSPITVSVPSFGAGNTNQCVSAWGYRQ